MFHCIRERRCMLQCNILWNQYVSICNKNLQYCYIVISIQYCRHRSDAGNSHSLGLYRIQTWWGWRTGSVEVCRSTERQTGRKIIIITLLAACRVSRWQALVPSVVAFSARRYIAVYAAALCLCLSVSVCHKSEFSSRSTEPRVGG